MVKFILFFPLCFIIFLGGFDLSKCDSTVAISFSWTNVSFELDSCIRSTNPNASKLTIKVDYVLLSSFYKREDRGWFWHVSSKTMEGQYYEFTKMTNFFL